MDVGHVKIKMGCDLLQSSQNSLLRTHHHTSILYCAFLNTCNPILKLLLFKNKTFRNNTHHQLNAFYTLDGTMSVSRTILWTRSVVSY